MRALGVHRVIQFGHGMAETGVTVCSETHGRIHRVDTR